MLFLSAKIEIIFHFANILSEKYAFYFFVPASGAPRPPSGRVPVPGNVSCPAWSSRMMSAPVGRPCTQTAPAAGALLPDFNVFNFQSHSARRTWLVVWPTCRDGKRYMACTKNYMPHRKSFSAGKIGVKRVCKARKKGRLRPPLHSCTTKIRNFLPESKLC